MDKHPVETLWQRATAQLRLARISSDTMNQLSSSKSQYGIGARSVPSAKNTYSRIPKKHTESSEKDLSELKEPPPEGWQRLTDLKVRSSPPPQLVRFADGAPAQAGTWMAFFRAVTRKLDDEGHFHPDTLPAELRKLVYVAGQDQSKTRRLPLSHGLTILNNWDPKSCLKVSIRLLEAFGRDPSDVCVR